jgi:hypothetical protein
MAGCSVKRPQHLILWALPCACYFLLIQTALHQKIISPAPAMHHVKKFGLSKVGSPYESRCCPTLLCQSCYFSCMHVACCTVEPNRHVRVEPMGSALFCDSHSCPNHTTLARICAQPAPLRTTSLQHPFQPSPIVAITKPHPKKNPCLPARFSRLAA